MKRCSVDSCERPYYGKGFCKSHYARVWRTGTTAGVDAPLRRWTHGSGTCSIERCELKARRLGMCNAHAARAKHSDVEPASTPLRPKAKSGAGHVNKAGYRTFRIGGRNIAEHRLLAEQYLGRQLRPHEQVHHRNGQRAENTIGPCFTSPRCDCPGGVRHNLEFWSTLQPGQRIADKIQWARELIATYETDEIDRECDVFAGSVLTSISRAAPANQNVMPAAA